MKKHQLVDNDPWQNLRRYTDARIALGHSGVSLPTKHHLSFQRDHAAARDAVNREINWPAMKSSLEQFSNSVLILQSQVNSRSEYLQRPDLGRNLSAESLMALELEKNTHNLNAGDVVIVITDGLSAPAIEQSAVPMVKSILIDLERLNLNCSTICGVKYGRVAVADKVAAILNSKHCIMLVGERPGLSSPNSLGIYYTFAARQDSNDADRNCISNIRVGGQSIASASKRLSWLIAKAEEFGFSGVELKDDSQPQLSVDSHKNFLLPDPS